MIFILTLLLIKYLIIDQIFLEEKSQGIGKTWYFNGQLCTYCTYKENNVHGLYQTWYPNGHLIYSCIYKEGKLDWSCVYNDDKENGLFQEWNCNGQLEISCHYKEGKKDGISQGFYKDGRLMYSYTYKDGNIVL